MKNVILRQYKPGVAAGCGVWGGSENKFGNQKYFTYLCK